MVFACAIVFTGCTSKNGYLNLMQTDMCASDFFYNTLDESMFIVDKGKSKNDKNLGLADIFFESKELMCRVVSVIDFCVELSQMEKTDGYEQKIYEYQSEYTYSSAKKYIVQVIKGKNANNKFTANLYEVSSSTTFMDAVNSENVQTNEFSITRDRATDVYTLIDSGKNVQATFYYSASEGIMKFSLSYRREGEPGRPQCEIDAEFYNYTNNWSGARYLLRTSLSNSNVSCVFEHLSKPFAKRAKIGYVGDKSKYHNLAKVEDHNIAVQNIGDESGHVITYNNSSTKESINIESYGL